MLAADGDHIDKVPGVTPKPNPYCASEPKWELDQTENPRSAGILVRYGKFRFLDLGDLTKAKEIPLVCPDNLIGQVDLFLVNHHGMNLSSTKAFVWAIAPRVAIMNNGAHKGGSPEAWETVHTSPGLEDLYMLHTAEGSDAAHNSAEELIANPKGDGRWRVFQGCREWEWELFDHELPHGTEQGIRGDSDRWFSDSIVVRRSADCAGVVYPMISRRSLWRAWRGSGGDADAAEARAFTAVCPFRVAVINDEISQDFDHACSVAANDFGLSGLSCAGCGTRT